MAILTLKRGAATHWLERFIIWNNGQLDFQCDDHVVLSCPCHLDPALNTFTASCGHAIPQEQVSDNVSRTVLEHPWHPDSGLGIYKTMAWEKHDERWRGRWKWVDCPDPTLFTIDRATHPSSGHQRLPPEIQLIVVEHAVDSARVMTGPFSNSTDWGSLVRQRLLGVLLACRFWYQVCEPLLHSTLSLLATREDVDRVLQLLVRPQNPFERYTTALALFGGLFTCCSVYARLAKRLPHIDTLSLSHENNQIRKPVDGVRVSSAIVCCHAPRFRYLSLFSSSVRTLEIQGPYIFFSSQEILHLLASFSSLETVRLRAIVCSRLSSVAVRARATRLSHLEVDADLADTQTVFLGVVPILAWPHVGSANDANNIRYPGLSYSEIMVVAGITRELTWAYRGTRVLTGTSQVQKPDEGGLCTYFFHSFPAQIRMKFCRDHHDRS